MSIKLHSAWHACRCVLSVATSSRCRLFLRLAGRGPVCALVLCHHLHRMFGFCRHGALAVAVARYIAWPCARMIRRRCAVLGTGNLIMLPFLALVRWSSSPRVWLGPQIVQCPARECGLLRSCFAVAGWIIFGLLRRFTGCGLSQAHLVSRSSAAEGGHGAVAGGAGHALAYLPKVPLVLGVDRRWCSRLH